VGGGGGGRRVETEWVVAGVWQAGVLARKAQPEVYVSITASSIFPTTHNNSRRPKHNNERRPRSPTTHLRQRGGERVQVHCARSGGQDGAGFGQEVILVVRERGPPFG